jgi:hypothetical protein
MPQHGSLPQARRDGLLEETVGEELLLYDQDSHTAHCLSPIAARVWRHCDGEHDLTGLAQLAGAGRDLIAGALHELREKDLLADEPALTENGVPGGVSRREAIVKAARYGATAAAGSMIVSATAATPAMASSEELKWCCQCTKGGGAACACIACQGNSKETGEEVCEKFCAGQKERCPGLLSAKCQAGQVCNNAVSCEPA